MKGSAISILTAKNRAHSLELLAKTLEGFPQNSTVFFIGRFKKDWDNLSQDCSYFDTTKSGNIVTISYLRRPDLQIRFLTAHASKGLEATNVIIINAKNGLHGFPSQIATHPIVRLLQGQESLFPYAEERRLFYVALTRTKTRSYILVDENDISPFVTELANINPSILHNDNRICPHCGSSLLKIDDPLSGGFFACEKYESGMCNYTQDVQWTPPSHL